MVIQVEQDIMLLLIFIQRDITEALNVKIFAKSISVGLFW